MTKIERALSGIITAIEEGMYGPKMKARMSDLEKQKAETAARLTTAEPPLLDVNPTIAKAYRRRVE